MKHTVFFKPLSVYIGIILLLPISALWAQQKHYVTESGAGMQDGTCWQHASANLLQVVENASPGDTVWVAEGTYYGGFLMKENVQVFGGFSGSESSLQERFLPGSSRNLTILDGDFSSRVLTQPEAFEEYTAWDGFIIQNGVSINGGGVYLHKKGVVRRCIIRNNYGGLYAIGDYVPAQGGIIFRVDANSKKAWVIAGEDTGRNYQIRQESEKNYTEIENAVTDWMGESNTKALTDSRAARIARNYRAPYPGQSLDDWYLPAAGEWAGFIMDNNLNPDRTLFRIIENSLVKNNLTPLSGKKYWSSTAGYRNNLPAGWYVNFESMDLNSANIWQYNKVRPVRMFDCSPEEGRGGGIFALTGSRVEGCLIYHNTSALGYAICARGDIHITNTTVVDNHSSSETIQSSAIDGNRDVRVINTIVTANGNASGCAGNYDNNVVYFSSAIETFEYLHNGNIALGKITEPDGASFVDFEKNNYSLRETSVCISAGNPSLLPVGLDSDLSGVLRTTRSAISVGAFEKSTGLSANDPLKIDKIGFYPSVLKGGEKITIEYGDIHPEERDIKVELFSLSGMKQMELSLSSGYQFQVPYEPGIYMLRISEKGTETGNYRIIVY